MRKKKKKKKENCRIHSSSSSSNLQLHAGPFEDYDERTGYSLNVFIPRKSIQRGRSRPSTVPSRMARSCIMKSSVGPDMPAVCPHCGTGAGAT